MPDIYYDIYKNDAIIIGWGHYREVSDDVFISPDRLQKATVPVINHEICTERLKDQLPGMQDIDFINENNFCTGPIYGNITVCTHDSGGPVVQNTEYGWIQIGVISWAGHPCGLIDMSGHMKTNMFIDWINKNIMTSD